MLPKLVRKAKVQEGKMFFPAPDSAWIKAVDDRMQYTPDIWRLQSQFYQPLFVYDEMMRGMFAHNMIKDTSILICPAFTVDSFSMWKKKLGKHTSAIAIQEPQFITAPPKLIRGEFFAVEPQTFIDLDNYRQNGVVFRRIEVDITIPHKKRTTYKRMVDMYAKQLVDMEQNGPKTLFKISKEKSYILKAWMYIGMPEFFSGTDPDDPKRGKFALDGGFLYEVVRSFKPNNPDLKPYYQFTQLELNEPSS